MSTPAVRAASRIEVPSGAATGLPSIVRLIVLTSAMNSRVLVVRQSVRPRPSGRGGRAERAPLARDVRLELVAPLLDARRDRHGAGIREHADRLPGHGVADLEQRVEVRHGAVTRFDALHDLGRPRGTLATL